MTTPNASTHDDRIAAREAERDALRCRCCGTLWAEHPDTCPRHAFRPGLVPIVADPAPDGGRRDSTANARLLAGAMLDAERIHGTVENVRRLAAEQDRTNEAPPFVEPAPTVLVKLDPGPGSFRAIPVAAIRELIEAAKSMYGPLTGTRCERLRAALEAVREAMR